MRMSPRLWIFAVALAAQSSRPASAQTFGGAPPWGPEKPVRFKGQLRRGETFERPIGNGLSFKVRPSGEDWDVVVTPTNTDDDLSSCVTPPFQGPHARHIMAWHFGANNEQSPGGLNVERGIDFVLNSKDSEAECQSLDPLLNGQDSDWGAHITGRCLFRPLTVKLSNAPADRQVVEALTFDGECALHGAWELWRLPVTYVVPEGFSGWVTVYYMEIEQPEIPKKGDRYLVTLTRSGTVHTSSLDLRADLRGALFVTKNGTAIAKEGPGQRIWDWQAGDLSQCSPYQSFFVGTAGQYRNKGQNPVLSGHTWDCAKLRRAARIPRP
jgi:hypothetical protein